MPTKYIGLTIGPIHRTMARTKATRELWASSYIFSYIMKKMIEKLKDSKEFIIPYTKDNSIFQPGQEVGLVHDRFIFKADDGDFAEVERVKKDVLNEIAEKMKKTISENNVNEISKFLNRYFQIYFCEAEIPGKYKEVNKQMNDYLDSLELQAKFIKMESREKNYLMDLFYRVNKSFLAKDAFWGKKKIGFPCIAEIAALKEKGDLNWEGIEIKFKDKFETDDTDIYIQLKKQNPKKFKQYHKYIAIVQADGDSLGAAIKALNDDADFGNLSKALLNFAKEAHKKIEKFGGKTIYAGGDDLLFFAPVVSGDENIFQLVDGLAREFAEQFKNFPSSPTLSAGISITYYKYPMGEALEAAADLLFKKAKDEAMGKNAVAFEAQKHSGQRFAGVFNRADSDYEKFTKLIFNKSDQKMLTSLIHKLALHETIIEEIGSDRTKLKNYFEHFFNEDEHKNHREMIDATADLVYEIFNNRKRNAQGKERGKTVFSVLRLKKFLEGGDE